MSAIRNLTCLLSLLALAAPRLVAQEAAAQAGSREFEQRQIGSVVLQGVPEWDAGIKPRMQQYLEVRRAGLADVAEDGRGVLISTRFGNTAQLHVVSMPMGMRRQITFFEEPVAGVGFVPGSGGKKLVFGKDVGGNEVNQFYLLDGASGSHKLLTDGKSRHEGAVLSRDGRYVAYSGVGRNGRDADIYLRDLNSEAPGRILWEVSGTYSAIEFSADSARLLAAQYVSEKETHYHLVDIATGRTARLTPEKPPMYHGGGAFSADGKWVYIFSDRDGEFRKLYRVSLDGGEWKNLTADIDWDVEEVAVDPAGKGIAFIVNEDGYSRLYFADADGGGRRPVAALPRGILGGLTFAAKGGVLGVTLDGPRTPSDVYTVTFPGGEATRWTESEIGGLNPDTFIEPAIIRYPTFDQVDGQPRQIPAFYYKAKGEGRRPVVILVHGGPESQYLPTFSSLIQYMVVELGISVIAPNVRGSTGYGRSFHQLDNGVKREDSVRDIGALLDWIEKQPELDASRVGIYGGSYGGYMVLASLANYPRRFKAGIDVVGIADFVTFLNNTAEYRRDLRREEYGDERDAATRKVLEEISPLKNAGKIEAALFVVHGANDPRVPVSEAEQIVARMRELGRKVWYAKALDEGHGFRKKPNVDLSYVLYAAFWREHLLK